MTSAAQGSAGTGIPGSIGSVVAMRARRSALELREPVGREHPRARALQALGLGVERVAKRVGEHRRVDRGRGVAALDLRHALGAPVPRRRRIDDHSPAERGLATKDDPVASGRHDRRREPQLRPPLPARTTRAVTSVGSEMDVDARTVRDRLELLERDVEAVRRRVCARSDERLSPVHVLPLDTRAGRPRRAGRRRLARPPGRAPGRSARAPACRWARAAARRRLRPCPTRACP